MRHLSWSSLRVRLVLAALLPAFAIILFSGLQERSNRGDLALPREVAD